MTYPRSHSDSDGCLPLSHAVASPHQARPGGTWQGETCLIYESSVASIFSSCSISAQHSWSWCPKNLILIPSAYALI